MRCRSAPDERFARLLSDLDDDDFTVRERATHELQQHGEPVRGQLVMALQGQLTPEVKSRVHHVLDEIVKDPHPIVRTTLWLADTDTQAGSLVRLLAEGEPNSWTTKRAKAILTRRDERKP